MSTHERSSEAAAFLLGELGAEERAAFERALAADPALRAEVERLRPVVTRLEGLPEEAWAEEVAVPPLRLGADVLGAASGAGGATAPAAGADAGAGPPAATPRRNRSRRWREPFALRPAFAALAAVALLAGGIAIGALLDGGGTPTPPTTTVQAQRTLTLDPIGTDPAAHGSVLVAERGTPHVTLHVRGLRPSRAGQFYELWLMDANGPLISLGSFRVGTDGRATVQMPLPVTPTKYQYFDISVQPEGDDANHSGDSVLRGATSA